MTIDLFVKSYKPDFWLLALSLETIKKNITGYNNIHILVPERDKEFFETRYLPERTLVHYTIDYGNEYLYQQACKVNAHKYCNGDFIMFSDSDVIFDHPVNLQDAINGGKPEILFTDYNQLPDAIIWKECTEKFIGEKVDFEFMRRLQLTYHRSTLVKIAEQYPNMEKRIMEAERFSEFNFLGAWCYKYERDKYTFTNTDNWQYVSPIGNQVWSHADKNGDLLHVLEWCRTLETIMKAFNVPVPVK